jgi:deazaflavin-dependent oxidoreductase (nitroreductase family)
MGMRRVVLWVQRHVVNPLARPVAGRIGSYALLETVGRKSGRPVQNPVGDGLRGDAFWIIAERGRKASYVRNMAANPRVRVKTHGRWRTGTAHLLDDDDPVKRQKTEKLNRLNAWVVRKVGTDLLSIRIDLEPE